MKDESNICEPQKEVTPSLLDAFDFLKSPKDDLKVTGGLKIISRLQEAEVMEAIYYKRLSIVLIDPSFNINMFPA